MVSVLSNQPEFGKADLSNCELEQIHLAGSIQPHGALLIVDEGDLIITQVSENINSILELNEELIGKSLHVVDKMLAEQIESLLKELQHNSVKHFKFTFSDSKKLFNSFIHKLPDSGAVIEFEPYVTESKLTTKLESYLNEIVSSLTLQELSDSSTRILKEVTGYDRVMVYRFDEDGHGEVFAESKEPQLEAFLGNRYPASDIPQIARRLYETNRIRVLVDVDYEPVYIKPRLSPITGNDIDMSLSVLRSMSPIHIQYLKNMGVSATLVISLMVAGKLWGLISCHHYSARNISYECRTASELLAESIATRIAALEGFMQAEAELSVKRIENRIAESVFQDGEWRSALFENHSTILKPFNASGAALILDGKISVAGNVPGTDTIKKIAQWLDDSQSHTTYYSNRFTSEDEKFSQLKSVAAGILATPITRSPGEYFIWFRPEQIQTVTWGGNPFKPVEVGDDPRDLSPRRSFSQWHQVVEGTSINWSAVEIMAAKLIGESIEDLIYQFRAVSTLIVQDQFIQTCRDVQLAQQPILVANQMGEILLMNEAFEKLLNPESASLKHIEELRVLFHESDAENKVFFNLLKEKKKWRGEIKLNIDSEQGNDFLLRADPVQGYAGKFIGFVLYFTNISERKIIESARKGFQENILERQHKITALRDTQSDPIYREIMSSVVVNARLAALEITDGSKLESVPEMLDKVEQSVNRTADLIERLIDQYKDKS